MRKEVKTVNEGYDSTSDTLAHRDIIAKAISLIRSELLDRAENHDLSKLEEPEKSTYDRYIPMLQKVKYGTEEYNKIKDKMAETGFGHHCKVNRHHPEYFEDGVRGMTLVDIVEMFCDWFSASKRSDTSFEKGMELNKERFGLSEELYRIMLNTYLEYFM